MIKIFRRRGGVVDGMAGDWGTSESGVVGVGVIKGSFQGGGVKAKVVRSPPPPENFNHTRIW